ncbi:predicted protein [Postia placenta Mad-698-R]|nr:predicted protein [Postia placenta Mad-698-R]
MLDTQRQLRAYKIGQGFSASQRWRSTIATDGAFPYCKLQRSQVENVRNLWQTIGNQDGAIDKLMNMHCIETNVIEGILRFDPPIHKSLVLHGFEDPAVSLKYTDIVGGAVSGDVEALAKADTVTLTVKTICDLHKILMQSSRILYVKTPHGFQLSYTTIGETRQHSSVNVMVQNPFMKIQFCPFDQVEAELGAFCERFNVGSNAMSANFKTVTGDFRESSHQYRCCEGACRQSAFRPNSSTYIMYASTSSGRIETETTAS